MFRNRRHIFILMANMLAMYGFTIGKVNAVGSKQKQGPALVKSSLIESGVFATPDVFFTDEYDEHKQYDNIKGLFFAGLNYQGRATRVFCWYGVPETLKPGDKAPAVVLVHGGGGTVFPQWVKKWTDRGYIAISVALEGQAPGPKNEDSPLPVGHPVHDFSGPFRKGFFLDLKEESLENQWFYHAVADVILANSLLRSFPEVDASRIGITGISWGGILTNVIAGIDDRFAFAIPVYGCGFLYEAPTYIKQLDAHTEESKQFYLTTWEPSLYMRFQKQPTLFINGTNDGHFSMNSFMKTYDASSTEKYLHIAYELKHGHGPGWDPAEIYRFADYVTKGSNAPLKFKIIKQGEAVSISGDLNSGIAYYTSDTADWSKESYKWMETGVRFSKSGRKVKAELPDDVLYYFVNGIDQEGSMYSSPMIKVKYIEPK